MARRSQGAVDNVAFTPAFHARYKIKTFGSLEMRIGEEAELEPSLLKFRKDFRAVAFGFRALAFAGVNDTARLSERMPNKSGTSSKHHQETEDGDHED
jgi:hypothetical protein